MYDMTASEQFDDDIFIDSPVQQCFSSPAKLTNKHTHGSPCIKKEDEYLVVFLFNLI